MYHGTIIQIDDCLVSEEILTEYFACDYEKCKGCCCVIGDSGAPMEECEAEAIEKNYHIFSPIMSQEGRDAVAAKGYYEIDMDGDMVTPLVSGSEECAYTLFDENAACHLAIGRGFSNVLKNFENYTEAQAHEKGINDSIIHVDFMIGTSDLDITAITNDGKEVAIFRGGEWAF
jgi:hypothetical protein